MPDILFGPSVHRLFGPSVHCGPVCEPDSMAAVRDESPARVVHSIHQAICPVPDRRSAVRRLWILDAHFTVWICGA